MDVSRRNFLKRSSAAVVGGAVALVASDSAFTAQTCGNYYYWFGDYLRECAVGFKINGVTARQHCEQWCWAACIEAAFKLYGYQVPQESIVKKLYGSAAICRASAGPGIAYAINGKWKDKKGKKFTARATVHLDQQFGIYDSQALINASRYLAKNVPVIIGALGHATLMTSISWSESGYTGYQQLKEIIVRDPWPSNPNRRVLRAEEFYGTTYMAAVSVKRG